MLIHPPKAVRALVAAFLFGAIVAFAFPSPACAQENESPITATIDTATAGAGEADAVPPKRRLVKWNEYDGPVSTLRIGYGFLVDMMGFSQDEESAEQVRMEPDVGLRDFRLLFRGKFKTKRPITWSLGYMYDGADKRWRFRQTGIQVGFPELAGRVFIGRTKEGFSMNKVMVGYHPWMIERTFVLDAFIPILADGVKWMGYFPKQRLYFSAGWYGDQIAEDEKFANWDYQTVGRVVWQPMLSDEQKTVLHLGVMGRTGKPDESSFNAKSKPEAYLAPNFLETGKFKSDRGTTSGVEAYLRKGSWFLGGEYDWQEFDHLPSGERPIFHGGTAAVAWIVTGETRPYNAPGAFFEAISPRKSVFAGGPGAWELVANYSYGDFDDESFTGGKLSRITTMANWHMSDNLRLEFVYGVSKLDRFDLEGTTHFFQSRVQTSL